MKRSSIEGLKHNAKLDVRLPDQLKDEFLARCREEGVSSGAVIRSMIIDYVMAQPRRWPGMAAGVKETIVKRSKWIVGGIGGGALAGLAGMSLLLAPAASALDVQMSYFIAVDREGDWSVASGVAELGGERFEISMFEGDQGLSFRLQAHDCGEAPREHCGEGQVFVELEYELATNLDVREAGSVHFIVEYGAPAGLGADLPDGRPLSAVFTPIES